MPGLTRREAIKGLVIGSAGLTLGGVKPSVAKATTDSLQNRDASQVVRAFRGQHQVKPLPFDPAKLRGLSDAVRTWERS